LRKLIAALWLGCALAVPAVAIDWKDEFDEPARETGPNEEPQSEWREGEWLAGTGPRVGDPIRAFTYAGDGWATLDGWMRRDPLLRQWTLQRFDGNGDSWLSMPEATSARHSFYALADANRSGIITSEEFLNGWGTVRAAMLDPYALAG
jgi:hypothetical protein